MKTKRVNRTHYMIASLFVSWGVILLIVLQFFGIGDTEMFKQFMSFYLGLTIASVVMRIIQEWQKDQEIEKDDSTILDRLSADEIEELRLYAEKAAEERGWNEKY